MTERMKISDKAEARLIMRTEMTSNLRMGGRFDVVCRDKNGKEKWREDVHNVWMNAYLTTVLDILFHGGSATATWYVFLHSDSSVLATWTAVTTSATEFTSYSGSRPAYDENAASSQSIDNVGNEASFTITGGGTIYGAGLTTAATGDTTICCAALFSASRVVAASDTVEVTYTCTSADDGV